MSKRALRLTLIAAAVVVVVLGVGLYLGLGGGGTDEALLGTWHGAEDLDTMEFRSDGTLIWTSPGYGREEIDYSTRWGRLTLKNSDPEGTSGTFPYSIESGALTIFSPDGEGHLYAREPFDGD